jgi:hypothetical protein
MDNHYNLKFQDFPITFSPIYIKEGAITYRYSKTSDPKTATLPRFFTELEGARIYDQAFGNKNNDIWFCIFKNLKLLDIRMLKYMIIEEAQSLTTSQLDKEENGYSLKRIIEIFMTAYGLMPVSLQGNLPNLKEPLQNYGYRKSITTEDDIAIAFMKRILYPEYDGYISPVLKSITNINTINLINELCLFNPSSSIKETRQLRSVKSVILKNLNTKDLKTDILTDYHYFNSDTSSIGLILTEQKAGGLTDVDIRNNQQFKMNNNKLYPEDTDDMEELLWKNSNSEFIPELDNNGIPIIKKSAAAWAAKVNNISNEEILNGLSKQIDILKNKIQNHFIYDPYYNK